jgi:hypothetical protein
MSVMLGDMRLNGICIVGLRRNGFEDGAPQSVFLSALAAARPGGVLRLHRMPPTPGPRTPVARGVSRLCTR